METVNPTEPTPTRIAILGATGYGGGELLRLLLQHPRVDVVAATSRSREGMPVGHVHRNLHGWTDLAFSSPTADWIAENADIAIGAMPHGASAETLAPLVDTGQRVIDLSGDFRLRDARDYAHWYRREHPRPDLLEHAVYGCPELEGDTIATARLVASPGCFATALNLAMLPAAAAGLLRGRPQVVAMTGSSGSGAEARPTTHHPERAATLRPYKVLAHQHVPEVMQLLADAGSPVDGIDFTPVSAPIVRGILAIVSAELADPDARPEDLYREFYAESPFVKVLDDREPEVASIAGSNYVEVRARRTPDGRLHAVCAIDNLVKGAAGQAVQSLNRMIGAPEELGLTWPGMWP
ncbi:MAG: N-acetyl-gamma-glutamyl-phosphate reductase [Deltaproteobacteria bacterium]|nr:MAG: N-acetyl-gamma-glutamyl-phosphate reductase [Deltaproteobacteria bacterium]